MGRGHLAIYKDDEALWLDRQNIRQIEGLEKCKHLKTLDLSLNNITNIAQGRLDKLLELQKLSLRGNRGLSRM